MKKVFISYNPYKIETELTVNKKKLAQNSKIGEKIVSGTRLQEWIEDLPRILIDEYNDNDFEITFHGTLLDYEDLTSVFTEALERNELTAKIEHRPAKETADKEVLIDDLFKEIQEGPFDELRDSEIISAFQHAKSSDFEVCVVATMSAGKSTLINAMLGTKLMPSKQEACTAIITRIKDISESYGWWQAEAYNQKGNIVETHKELTYSTMELLNANENVSEIKVEGNIPFVSSEDVSLVLIDTPGPNNSRDPHHKKVQSEFLGKSSKSLVLYIMTGEFGVDDDNTLLKRVADSMAVGGKQSKDRFIFVVNKLDDRKKEDGDTEHTLERVREYLKTHGVANPNLFPAAALPALNIRLIESGTEVDEDTKDETEMKVRKLNRNETLHFETYASLPTSIRGDIAQRLNDAKEKESAEAEALIHTGITCVEAAIRQYVQKYAKTAKIKNVVDTFMHKLDEVGCFEETKRELAKNRNESERIVKQIDLIRKKIDDVKLGKKFKDAVDNAFIKVNNDFDEVVDKIIEKFQSHITTKLDALRNQKLDIDKAIEEVKCLESLAKKLAPDFELELDELIRDGFVKTGNVLLDEYRSKLASLTKELELEKLGAILIDPMKLMARRLVVEELLIKNIVKAEKVVDGTELVLVPREPILGLGLRDWILGMQQEERETYVTRYFVDGSELAQEYLALLQCDFFNIGNKAKEHASKQSKSIVSRFNSEFNKLDNVLKANIDELESYATNQKKAEERIAESECKLKWLEQIKTKVEGILEI